ncbi:MAG: ankyrin repeat domain-containing protein [Candidatus Gastranaerophilales bacterium]|nr:ankyrin repeat domain-containing protein [Candidatus Gastranaerophilales bacterium]
MKKIPFYFLLAITLNLCAFADIYSDYFNALNQNDTAKVQEIIDNNKNFISEKFQESKENEKNEEMYETALHFAVERRSIPITKLLLENKADPNIRNGLNMVPLRHLLVGPDENRIEIAKLLLENKADPNAYDDGFYLINLAATCDSAEFFQLLIDYGADINQKSKYGTTPIDDAEAEGNYPLINFIAGKTNLSAKTLDKANKLDFSTYTYYAKSSGFGDTEFRNAISYNNDEEVNKLLKTVNLDEEIEKCRENLFILAASKGYKNVVDALLEHGVDINTKNSDGFSALFIVSAMNNKEMVKYLISKGADINQNADNGLELKDAIQAGIDGFYRIGNKYDSTIADLIK